MHQAHPPRRPRHHELHPAADARAGERHAGRRSDGDCASCQGANACTCPAMARTRPRHVRDMPHRSNTATCARTWPRSARSVTRLCWARVATQTQRGRVRFRSSRSMTRTRGGGCARPPATRRRASPGRQRSSRLLPRSIRPPWQHSSRLLSRSVRPPCKEPGVRGGRGPRERGPRFSLRVMRTLPCHILDTA